MKKVMIGIGVICFAGSLAFLSGCAKEEKAPAEAAAEVAAEAAPEAPALSE